MKRTLISALLIACGSFAGCDLCGTAAQVHNERCMNGVQESCDWLAQNLPPIGYCEG